MICWDVCLHSKIRENCRYMLRQHNYSETRVWLLGRSEMWHFTFLEPLWNAMETFTSCLMILHKLLCMPWADLYNFPSVYLAIYKGSDQSMAYYGEKVARGCNKTLRGMCFKLLTWTCAHWLAEMHISVAKLSPWMHLATMAIHITTCNWAFTSYRSSSGFSSQGSPCTARAGSRHVPWEVGSAQKWNERIHKHSTLQNSMQEQWQLRVYLRYCKYASLSQCIFKIDWKPLYLGHRTTWVYFIWLEVWFALSSTPWVQAAGLTPTFLFLFTMTESSHVSNPLKLTLLCLEFLNIIWHHRSANSLTSALTQTRSCESVHEWVAVSNILVNLSPSESDWENV